MPHTTTAAIDVTIHLGEVLGPHAFTEADVARACSVSVDWVRERVGAGVLQAVQLSAEWRFDSVTLLRARRLAALEAAFDADPQLAALTADLIEEVLMLRHRVHRLEARS